MFDKLTKTELRVLADTLMNSTVRLYSRRIHLNAQLRSRNSARERLRLWNEREAVVAMRAELGDTITELYQAMA